MSTSAPRVRSSDSSSTGSRRLLTLPEAAEVLHLSVHSVRRLILSGKLPVVKLTRRLLVDVRDIDRLIDGSKGRVGW
jgi:excisionase family DNA binding protein